MNRPAADAARIAHRWGPQFTDDGVIRAARPNIVSADEAIASDVLAERARQDRRWGEQNHPDGTGGHWETDWCGGLGGEFPLGAQGYADLIRACCQAAAADGAVTWRHILHEEIAETFAETDPARLRAELVEVAAVAQAWIADIDRRATAAPRPAQALMTVDLPTAGEEQ